MVVNDIPFTLKDGRKAIIRSAKEEDIPSMLEYLRISAGETEYILRYPEECSKYTYENEKQLFEQINTSEKDAMLVCIVDGKVAGNCQISFNNKIKTRHRVAVAIALLSEFWNQGIGTRFFEELIRIAEADSDVLQMELEYVEGNSRARHLYEKMGFRLAGVHPNAIKLKDGTLLNEYLMIKTIRKVM